MERLEKYIKQIRGISYSPKDISLTQDKDFLPVLKANNIQEGILQTGNLIYIHKSKIKDEQFIRKGDILIAASSGSKAIVGKSVFFKENFYGGFGAFCKVIRPNENVYPQFVSMFFKTSTFKRHILKVIQGANINNLRNDDINSLKIPKFLFEDQIKIATILSKVEALIKQRKESIALLDVYLKSVFWEMFGDPVRNEKGWERLKFSQLAKIDRKQIIPINISNNDFYIGLEDIEKETGLIIKNSTQNAEELKSSKFKFTSNHILYAKLRPYLNKVASPIIDGICSTDIFPILPIKDIAEKYFICYLMRSNFFVKEMTMKSAGANLPRANADAIENLKVYSPPPTLQKKFGVIVEKVEELKVFYKNSLHELENLFSSLSQKAFKGQLNLSSMDNVYKKHK